MDLDSDLDSKLSTGWVGFQICEILWIWIRFWIQFCPWVGSDYGFVFLLGFGFGFGLIFFLKSESESVNPNPTTSSIYYVITKGGREGSLTLIRLDNMGGGGRFYF